ncbi:MAG TPA: YsnF/AvaK domain-containing protein [Hymenobacter sp.]|jgi:uncharacterized protein (TIGR02271 family)|uniref:YsnF/AvaK domain-containing protein n=1 Tax=Hymenobacter sp. TaxID=1898978 RepID=UPI002ED7C3A3
MAQTVIGLFNSASEAQQAVQKLMSAGFIQSNVDVAAQDAQRAQHLVANESSSTGSSHTTDTDPGANDSIGNFFSNLFGGNDNDDARAYTTATRGGRSVVTVHAATAEEAERARDLLDDNGAIDVHAEYAQARAASGTQTATAGTAATSGQTTGALPIIEENLQVGKRVEQTGGARIRSRIIERPIEEHVRLREEHVNIQRRDVNRPATEADFAAFKEGEISVTESAERAVVAKEARVVGEVNIGKEVTERDETVRGTVRSTDVQVEQLGANQTRTTDTDYDETTRTNR